VAFRFADNFKEKNPEIQQKWIQTLLRAKGWLVILLPLQRAHLKYPRIVPNYELPPEVEKTEILRVVVREHMTVTVCLPNFMSILLIMSMF
jgi:glutamate decarboxylase